MNPSKYTDSQGRVDINSIVGDMIDRGIWIYYDQLLIAGAASPVAMASSYQFFSIPIGQGTPAKTKLNTNMLRGNQFPPPRCLILDQVSILFASNMIKADIDGILNNYYAELKIDDKIYFEGPLHQFSSGYGLTGVTTNTAEAAYTLGAPDFTAIRRFGDYSKLIAPQQQFSFVLYAPGTVPTPIANNATPTAGTGINFYIYLGGLTDRAVA